MKLQGKFNKSLANPVYADTITQREFCIIDTRIPEDYQQAHISEAENIFDFATLSQKILENPDVDFLIHCYSGHTVSVYGSHLVEMGAKNVFYFDGSFAEIYNAIQKIK